MRLTQSENQITGLPILSNCRNNYCWSNINLPLHSIIYKSWLNWLSKHLSNCQIPEFSSLPYYKYIQQKIHSCRYVLLELTFCRKTHCVFGTRDDLSLLSSFDIQMSLHYVILNLIKPSKQLIYDQSSEYMQIQASNVCASIHVAHVITWLGI